MKNSETISCAISVGEVQLQILRVLWREGQATARVITEALAKERPIAHSTVQTLIRQLEAKGAVSHLQQERTFYFRALVDESEVTRSAAQDLLKRMFQGSLTGLVAHLLEQENISQDEIKRLRTLVDAKAKETQS